MESKVSSVEASVLRVTRSDQVGGMPTVLRKGTVVICHQRLRKIEERYEEFVDLTSNQHFQHDTEIFLNTPQAELQDPI